MPTGSTVSTVTAVPAAAAVGGALLDAVFGQQADPRRGTRDDALVAAVTGLCRVHPPRAVADAAAAGLDAWRAAVDDLAGRSRGGAVLVDRLAAWVDAGIADLRRCRRDAPASPGLRATTDGLLAWRDHLDGRGGLLDCGRARGLHGDGLAVAAAGALLVALDMLAAAVELDLDHDTGSQVQDVGRELAAVRGAQGLVTAAARRPR